MTWYWQQDAHKYSHSPNGTVEYYMILCKKFQWNYQESTPIDSEFECRSFLHFHVVEHVYTYSPLGRVTDKLNLILPAVVSIIMPKCSVDVVLRIQTGSPCKYILGNGCFSYVVADACSIIVISMRKYAFQYI